MSEQVNHLSNVDTAQIFSTVLESKSIVEDNPNADTIFVIKSKFFNPSYPKKTKYFKVCYIENIPENKIFNHPKKRRDRRVRFDIVDFSLKSDTGYFSMVDCGVNIGYHYKLVKDHKHWVTKKERVDLF